MKWYPPRRTHPIRLEPKPWTGRERRKRLPEWTGTVVATSDFGIKVVDGGGWLNWSVPDYRGQPFDDCQKGDKVRFEYAEVEKDGKKKTYISVIENLSRPQTAEPDNPFPPGEDFPPSDGFGATENIPSDPPGSPPEGALDKDHSIVRQTCIKAAGMALQHNMGNAEEKAGQMTYLAGVLEDWCWR